MSLSGHEFLKVLLWAKRVPSRVPSTLNCIVSRGACKFSCVWIQYLRTTINGLRFLSNQWRQRFWRNSSQMKGKEFVETCIYYRTCHEQVGIWGWQCGQNRVSVEGQPQATNCTLWLAGHMGKDFLLSQPQLLYSQPHRKPLPKYIVPATGLSQN